MPLKPNPPLTTAQKELIKKWINEGAKETKNCATTCDANVFSYSAAVKPILEANCVGCHNGPAAPLGIVLNTYTGVKAAATTGRLLGAIKHQTGFSPMPKGSSKLSDCKISQIEKWIQAGAPNN
jgi:ribosomal protein S16